jgi:GntR family transcriptional regulator of vanillate catabolism
MTGLLNGDRGARSLSDPEVDETRDRVLHNVLARIEIQGALEGLAVRWAAERGISALQREYVRNCLASIDDLIGASERSAEMLTQFLALNAKFHRLMTDVVQCPTLSQHVEKEPVTVFGLPRVSQMLASNPSKLHAVLTIEQDQHYRIVEAIETGMGARAEGLVREHSLLARRHLLDIGPDPSACNGRQR